MLPGKLCAGVVAVCILDFTWFKINQRERKKESHLIYDIYHEHGGGWETCQYLTQLHTCTRMCVRLCSTEERENIRRGNLKQKNQQAK